MKLLAGRVCLVLVLLLALPAAAETKAEAEARALFREGNRRLAAADYVGALDLFRAAHARQPNPKILLNIGTTLHQLGRYAEAVDTYEKYRAHKGSDPKRRAEVAVILKELATKVATLRITVNEPGARVLVDGKAVGESPQQITLRIDLGSHSVVAEKAGFPTVVTTVSLAGGEERLVALRLVGGATTPPPPPPDKGGTEPVSPPPPSAVTPGTTVAPPSGGAAAPSFLTQRRIWGLVAGGVALACFGTSGYFVGAAASKHSQLDTLCPGGTCKDQADLTTGSNLRSDGKRALIGGNVMLGLGIAASVASGYLLVFGGAKKSKERPTVSAALSPGGGGLVLGGVW